MGFVGLPTECFAQAGLMWRDYQLIVSEKPYTSTFGKIFESESVSFQNSTDLTNLSGLYKLSLSNKMPKN